ncbi:hypothetical protein KZZ52_55065 [Dactylosporangium sp. AC04546]|uniref:LpqB family beta-propeller domain-containing protein n=1 Tax=Dactylosporangium sp. AC04546 TaxID=2862460 RepID=UPI001EE0973A|nr:LpqB family beta-propeller domain-containing protein [Dactylosporangium sp. AC04546]WVK82959.1 hypothetical protein KZZ52_55065 [Dactylosporangium sp. AC04546]
MRRRRLAALLTAAAMALAGCGLPGRTDPKYVEPAATMNPAPDRVESPPSPVGAATAAELVDRFLEASVGGNRAKADNDEVFTETLNRMRSFLTPASRGNWFPTAKSKVQVVRATTDTQEEDGNGGWWVPVSLERVGTLTPDGRLDQDPGEPYAWKARVETVNGQLLLANAPSDSLLLSTTGLDNWYQQQPVYFWEKGVEDSKLVPDLRYMSKLLTRSQRVAEVMGWLRGGPGTLVQDVVDGFFPDIEMKDTPVVDASGVTINLTIRAAANDKNPEIPKAARQIRWSLEGHPQVKLLIENADRGINADGYENDYAAAALDESDPDRFVVANESARPVELASGVPGLFREGGDNTQVVSAAINRSQTHAALVRRTGDKQTLYVSAADAATTGPPKYVAVPEVSGARLSRPVWIDRPVPLFLVSNGVKLFAVTPPTGSTGVKAEPVLNPQGEMQIGGIASLAVAPDGRRIAFVTGNSVNVVALQFNGGRLKLGPYQQVATSLGGNQAVGWITETTLAVGGTRNPNVLADQAYSLVSITIDGTAEKPLPRGKTYATASYSITDMSVRTANPTGSPGAALIMFEANGIAHTVYNTEISAIKLNNGGPSVSPSASTNPGQVPQARAPFYAGE